jgi:3-hydroxyacyl-CoA dehydrogenase
MLEESRPEPTPPQLVVGVIGCGGMGRGIAQIAARVVLDLGDPIGPLAWGDRLGATTVLTILKHLEQQTGDALSRQPVAATACVARPVTASQGNLISVYASAPAMTWPSSSNEFNWRTI